jgi:HSP20 family protein
MADTKTNRTEETKEGGQKLAQRDRDARSIQRRDPSFINPFEWMNRISDEMGRTFDRVSRDFGFPGRSWLSSDPFDSAARFGNWSPRVEAFQKGDRFFVRAELPGLKKDDVHVDLRDGALTIHGERREEHEDQREGYYHSERQYGRFQRTVPLPDGVIEESAQASFRDGVLEITMQAAPVDASRARKVEIKDESESVKE